MKWRSVLLFSLAFGTHGVLAQQEAPPTVDSVLAASVDADWTRLAQDKLLYLFLDDGTVVFEVAREFAPAHIANIKRLTRGNYFDGLAIIRAQDNYVVQWGDPAAGSASARSFAGASVSLQPEFYRDLEGLQFNGIDSRDAYADRVGFVGGMPAGTDGNRAWLAHCYGMLGVGRDVAADSGSGAELYVVTGHAPRHLDRNVTLLGRVVKGIELLSTLPRGSGPLGFYESDSEHLPIQKMRFGNQLPVTEQISVERLRTDTATFGRYVEALRNRANEWFVDPGGRIGICNIAVPVRAD